MTTTLLRRDFPLYLEAFPLRSRGSRLSLALGFPLTRPHLEPAPRGLPCLISTCSGVLPFDVLLLAGGRPVSFLTGVVVVGFALDIPVSGCFTIVGVSSNAVASFYIDVGY